MDWVKLGVRYYFDAAIRGLDGDLADAAEVMFTRGLARAGEVGRDGFIPEQDVSLLTRRRRYAALVSALIAAGLWTEAPGGYRVAKWSDWQDALDALTKRRKADRERKRASRAAEREELVRRHGDRCRRCGTNENLVIDHIVPLSRGGNDDDTNKQLLCWSCNARKRNLTDEEYDAWLARFNDPPPNPTPPNKRVGVTLSADISADVQALEGEGERELGGVVQRATGGDQHARPPPRTCAKHPDGTDDPCRRCESARHAHEAWHADKRTREANAPKCPEHPGQLAHNCGGCAADRKAAA